ncbi:MAG: anti-sigma factor [Mycobacterium sp.]
MTQPSDFELLELATAYALHAVSDDECADIEHWLSRTPATVSRSFHDEVRAVRETMAVVSAGTSAEPPPEMRDRLLKAVRPARKRFGWRTSLLAAAAVLIIGLGALTAGLALHPAQAPTTAEQVFAAPDVHTVSGAIPGGGTATVVFSREKNAGVLVMNDVSPPKPGTVYQMWLIGEAGPTSAGTMDEQAVAPSTTAVLRNLGDSTALAFTVEPGAGSQKPTSPAIAELALN